MDGTRHLAWWGGWGRRRRLPGLHLELRRDPILVAGRGGKGLGGRFLACRPLVEVSSVLSLEWALA